MNPILVGLSSYIPIYNRRFRKKGGQATTSARYCYSVWLRHLILAHENGLDTCPEVIAELGPGHSLGTGLAALITGCEKYYALDITEHSPTEKHLQVFDDLVALFKNREAIPGANEYPRIKPTLTDCEFPAHILTEERLGKALDGARLAEIRDSVAKLHDGNSRVQYKVPWDDPNIIDKESVDLVFSQAVLEHVDDLEGTYKAMREWLKPDGYTSHVIGLNSHGISREWNGHWIYSEFVWRLIRGTRPYLLNRAPHSWHVTLLEEEGFEIICDQTYETESNLTLNQLASKFRTMTDQDLITSSAFIQARKSRF